MLSVIIPVYRTEQTLDDCVRSVLKSCSGTDVQIVLVDDGSPDGCPQKCDEWAARDTRIEVVHRANGGLSAARNSGLDMARGEWVTFVDSDDVVDCDFKGATDADADIIEYPIVRHHDTSKEILLQWGDETYTSAKDYWHTTEGWTHSYACNKFFRRHLFDDIRFPEGRAFEDIWTTPMLLQKARTIRTITKGRYGYNDNAEGISMTAGGLQLTSLLEGNIQAAGIMGLSVRHYAAMVNIQIDVYRSTRRMLLRREPLPLCEVLRLPLLPCLKVLLPLRLLCCLSRACNLFPI